MAEFLSENRSKLHYLLITVIVFAVGLCIYYSPTQPKNDQDFTWDDAEQNNLEKQITGDDSTLVFATVVKLSKWLIFVLIHHLFGEFEQIFRHGDRTPTNSFKTDPYADGTFYIEGRGALTLVLKIISIINFSSIDFSF